MSRHLAPVKHRIERYGSAYGGWNVPVDLIRPDWVIYNFGVGEDISFDIALMERHQCVIHAFDPTPKAIAFAEKQGFRDFRFYPVGVWNCDTTIKLYQPTEPGYASYSAFSIFGRAGFIEAEVKTVKSLADELGHKRIDLVKMDVEGAEQVVIPNMIADGILPTVICVEYDQPLAKFRWMTFRCFVTSLRLNRALLNAGYQLISKNGWTATYLHANSE